MSEFKANRASEVSKAEQFERLLKKKDVPPDGLLYTHYVPADSALGVNEIDGGPMAD